LISHMPAAPRTTIPARLPAATPAIVPELIPDEGALVALGVLLEYDALDSVENAAIGTELMVGVCCTVGVGWIATSVGVVCTREEVEIELGIKTGVRTLLLDVVDTSGGTTTTAVLTSAADVEDT